MAITREKLMHIGLKETFAVTKDFVYFFSSNSRLASLALLRTDKWKRFLFYDIYAIIDTRERNKERYP